jgi:hypothetical protein
MPRHFIPALRGLVRRLRALADRRHGGTRPWTRDGRVRFRSTRLLDPVPYATSALVIVTACLLAALLPTWRAVRIDPIATLRKE